MRQKERERKRDRGRERGREREGERERESLALLIWFEVKRQTLVQNCVSQKHFRCKTSSAVICINK